MRRSTRQSSKPVTIELKMTEHGFEIIDEKIVLPPPVQKIPLPRPEKPLNYSKSLVTKTSDRVVDTPPYSSMGSSNEALMRSRTSVKPPMTGTRVPYPNGEAYPQKNPVGRPPSDPMKREINTFANISMPSMRMGSGSENIGDHHFGSHHYSGQSMAAPTMTGDQHHAHGRPSQKPSKKFMSAIPSCASWFDMDKIHEIEKDFVSEYFQGKPAKTPENYKRSRNYMINLYRKDPMHYLTPTASRKVIGGDACSLMRIHTFLEHWGLINFYVEPSSYPTKSFFLNKVNYTNESAIGSTNELDFFDPSNQESDSESILNRMKLLNKNSRPMCDFCGIICGFSWYQQKAPEKAQPANPIPEGEDAINNPPKEVEAKAPEHRKIVLCGKCYTEGNFPNLYTAENFIKFDPSPQDNGYGITAKPRSTKTWYPEDTLKLLELIQVYGEDWNEIQKKIPHKTKEELAMHYLRLPKNGVTSLNILEMGEFKGHEETGTERLVDQVPTVFGDYSNPILQYVASFNSLLKQFKEEKKEKERREKEIQEAAKKAAEEAIKAEEAAKVEEKVEEKAKVAEVAKPGEDKKMEIEEVKEDNEEVKENKEEVKEDIEEIQIEKEPAKPENNEVKENGEKMVIEVEKEKETVAPIVVPEKTKEELFRETADRVVELQIQKLNEKVKYIGDYENFLMRERTQHEMFQQALLADKIEFAKKRMVNQKQHPPAYQGSVGPFFESKESSNSFFGIGGQGGFGEDEHVDFSDPLFPKESF